MPWPYVPLLWTLGRAEEPSWRLTHGFATHRMARVIGLWQASLRRYCLILREHETSSSQAETSGRRDMDLPASRKERERF